MAGSGGLWGKWSWVLRQKEGLALPKAVYMSSPCPSYLGQVELVRLLLQARAGVDLPDEEGSTALHYAALG